MKTFINISQIIVSFILIGLIFLQSHNTDDSRSHILTDIHLEKRGWEKITFILTICILVLFLLLSIIQILI